MKNPINKKKFTFTYFKNLLHYLIWKELPKKDNNENFIPDFKRLMKFDYGKLFKGHRGSISVASCNNHQAIYLENSYFASHVSQRYDLKKGITYNKVYSNNSTPKWLKNKITDLSLAFNIPTTTIELTYDKENIQIGIHEDFMTFQVSNKFEGLHFEDHYDSINRIKSLNKLESSLKYNLKHRNIESIVNMLSENDNNIINQKLKNSCLCLELDERFFK